MIADGDGGLVGRIDHQKLVGRPADNDALPVADETDAVDQPSQRAVGLFDHLVSAGSSFGGNSGPIRCAALVL
jgi:hypothetical protein